MGPSTSRFVSVLYNVFMNVVLDEDDEVRSNAIYGLGVYASNGGPTVLPYTFGPVIENLCHTYL